MLRACCGPVYCKAGNRPACCGHAAGRYTAGPATARHAVGMLRAGILQGRQPPGMLRAGILQGRQPPGMLRAAPSCAGSHSSVPAEHHKRLTSVASAGRPLLRWQPQQHPGGIPQAPHFRCLCGPPPLLLYTANRDRTTPAPAPEAAWGSSSATHQHERQIHPAICLSPHLHPPSFTESRSDRKKQCPASRSQHK